ncbi:SDR family NAD(P)-dependent oxidoreductase [Cyanobium sp. PCC 7001]|uniref:SDR family NAD(P)-dependent oxidoreductase n=1 Tax=Cyanobium sp. PCC 7001 TaxID=180281 RepID=UPI0005B7ACA8|nr:SDR family NAD(P)-dependent oxidoreductase [Cyanobium sp. PCC 7001]
MDSLLPPLSQWQGLALVVGSGGIGMALLRALAQRAPGLELVATSRRPPPTAGLQRWVPLDVTCDESLENLSRELAQGPPLRLVINTVGLLHGPDLQPEKRLAQLRRSALERSFAVNAFGPVLLAQALEGVLPRQSPFQFASLSARVGSIGDNGLGGWYSYRAAKAAQNQLLRTLALEWRRRFPQACVSLLHPGTTATALSQPFQATVPTTQLFSAGRAAGHLLDVLEGLGPEQSGGFWAWDGQRIPW